MSGRPIKRTLRDGESPSLTLHGHSLSQFLNRRAVGADDQDMNYEDMDHSVDDHQ